MLDLRICGHAGTYFIREGDYNGFNRKQLYYDFISKSMIVNSYGNANRKYNFYCDTKEEAEQVVARLQSEHVAEKAIAPFLPTHVYVVKRGNAIVLTSWEPIEIVRLEVKETASVA